MICILVRDFAAFQERRLNPMLSELPLVLVEAGKYRPKVIAPDAAARQAGVKAGMWLGQARTLCPHAEFLPVEEERYRRIFEDVTLVLLDITDRIEPEYQPTSAVWYSDDPLMLSHLLEAVQQQTGIQPQIGMAATKFAARVAAASAPPGITCKVANGDEKAFLSPYPVTLLPLDKQMTRRLPLLGIHRLGQLAALPRIAVWEQFGKHGRWMHDLASGTDIRPLSPYKVPPSLRECHNFEDAIADRQIVQHVLERMSLRLIERLEGRRTEAITLLLSMEDGSLLEHHRQPHEPVRDGLSLLRLLLNIFASMPISGAVSGIEVRLGEITSAPPRQLSLFDEPAPVQSLEQLAPKWAHKHRRACFYRLALTGDEHLPERAIEKQKVTAG